MTSATASGPSEGGVSERKRPEGRSSAVALRSRTSASPFRPPIPTTSGTSSGTIHGMPTSESEPDSTAILDPVSLTLDERRGPSEILGVIASQFQLPSLYQPSRAAAFQQHFVSYLISSLRSPLLYQTNSRSWPFLVPTLLTS